MARLAAFLILVLTAMPAASQVWQGDARDDGSYLHGTAVFNQGAVTLWCAAPSPQGLDPSLSDANLVAPMAPYAIRLMVGEVLARPPGTPEISVVLWIDGQGALVPLRVFGEEQNLWSADIAMADPTIERLSQAQTFTLEVRGGTHWEVGTQGLGTALIAALRHCVSGWQQSGQPLPLALKGLEGGTAAPSGPPAQATDVRTIAQAYLNRRCEGLGSAGPKGFAFGDIDGDGVQDILVDWSDVTCAGSMPRPFCGASLCGGDILLSHNNHVFSEGDALLGLSHSLVPLDNGNQGVASSGNLSMCQSQSPCGFLSYWDGAQMQSTKY